MAQLFFSFLNEVVNNFYTNTSKFQGISELKLGSLYPSGQNRMTEMTEQGSITIFTPSVPTHGLDPGLPASCHDANLPTALALLCLDVAPSEGQGHHALYCCRVLIKKRSLLCWMHFHSRWDNFNVFLMHGTFMLSEQQFCMICMRAFMAFKSDSESQKSFCMSDG